MDFRQRVLKIVSQIPAGQILTYQEVAWLAGRPRAYRSVGNILNKNYNLQIPCHRVIRSNGLLGGFNRGAKAKKKLLRSEKNNNVGRHSILEREFFARPALVVARELLGKFLVRRLSSREKALLITETEAYIGPEDKASHAHRGLTPRTKVMFGPAGHWYIYFTYGMHWLLNIVIGKEGYPAAVLIRSVREINGPARLTKFLRIDKKFNGKEASRKTGLWIEDRGIILSDNQIKRSSRIGVSYAREWANKPYRFLISN